MISWDFAKQTPATFRISNVPRSRCCVCYARIHGQQRRKGFKPGKQVRPGTRYDIYKWTRTITGERQSICKQCMNLDADTLEINAEHATQQQVQIPAFLEQILDTHTKRATAEQKQKQQKENQKYKRRKDSSLYYYKLDASQVKVACGLTPQNLEFVVDHVNNKRNGKLDIVDLFIACSVWWNNTPYRWAAVQFGYAAHSSIQSCVDRVIDALSGHWVPDHIGYGYWRHHNVRDHVPAFVDELFPDQHVVAVADATYLYSQKSKLNYQYQKCSYSVYKGRNLQKEHVVCTPDGYILFVDGPFFADGHNNDQIIWDWIVHDDDHNIHRILPHHDRNGESLRYSVVADRGYTRCIDHDTYKLVIPHGVQTKVVEEDDEEKGKKKKKKRKPLTVQQGNDSNFRIQKRF